jgi:hypothetical protein
MAGLDKHPALEAIRAEVAMGQLRNIERNFIEWVAEYCIDPDACYLARRVLDRIETGS